MPVLVRKPRCLDSSVRGTKAEFSTALNAPRDVWRILPGLSGTKPFPFWSCTSSDPMSGSLSSLKSLIASCVQKQSMWKVLPVLFFGIPLIGARKDDEYLKAHAGTRISNYDQR